MSDIKDMTDWTVKEVSDWIGSKRGQFGSLTGAMIEACETFETNGSALAKGDLLAIQEIFALPAKETRLLFSLVKAEKHSRLIKKSVQVHTTNNNNNSNSNSSFTLNMEAKGKRFVLDEKVNGSTTVRKVQELYYEQERAALTDDVMFGKLKSVRLISNGKALESGKTLADYGIINEHNLVSVLFNALGGTTASVSDLNEFRDRKVNLKKFPHLKRTIELPDCISMEYEDETALMPCGHAISPDMMYMYIKHIFHETVNEVVIPCPVPKCNTEWDWQLVTAVADMSSEEYLKWTKIRNRRFKATRDERDCPHCAATCKRKDGVVIFRMRCGECTNSDWCWECGKPWNHSGLYICGNTACKVITNLNSNLANCTTIEQAVKDGHHSALKSWMGNVEFLAPCPSIRACPRCFTLMFHEERCKHMKCVNCLKYFCFYCLALREENSDSYGGMGCFGAFTKCKNGMKAKQCIR